MRCNRICLGVLVICVLCGAAGAETPVSAGRRPLNAGVVFKLNTLGTESVLYSFTGGADGGNPLVGVIRDRSGNFYGTADTGGATNAGVVYKIVP